MTGRFTSRNPHCPTRSFRLVSVIPVILTTSNSISSMLAPRSHLVHLDPFLALEIIEGYNINLCIAVSMLTLIVYNAC